MSSFHSRTTTWKLATPGQRVGEVGELVVVRGEDRLGRAFGFDARCSATAHARLRPSNVAVPRPISSRITRLREVALCRMFAVSCISTMKVDWPRAMLSDAPTRANSRSTIGSLAVRAGDERSGLRHQAEQRGLAQVGRLAAHVRTGEDDELMRRAIERDVVRHERVRRRSARRPDAARRPRPARRRRASAASCSCSTAAVSASAASTSSAARPRAVSWMRGASAATRGAQRLEQLDFALDDPLVGAEHLLFVLLQRRRDEALAAGDGLLAVVVGRHAGEVRLRDLDVVAEHAVVADLERCRCRCARARRPPSRRCAACRSG